MVGDVWGARWLAGSYTGGLLTGPFGVMPFVVFVEYVQKSKRPTWG